MTIDRAGIRRIVLPAQNEPDIDEIPEDLRKELEVIPVKHISEVIAAALERTPSSEGVKPFVIPAVENGRDADRLVAKDSESGG